MGSTVFRNPRALSSALAALGTLQPRALGFLNTVDPLDTVSNCYLANVAQQFVITRVNPPMPLILTSRSETLWWLVFIPRYLPSKPTNEKNSAQMFWLPHCSPHQSIQIPQRQMVYYRMHDYYIYQSTVGCLATRCCFQHRNNGNLLPERMVLFCPSMLSYC